MLPEISVRASLAVSLGAIPGALSRYYITLILTHLLGDHFPYATMLINLTGCFLMGLLVNLLAEHWSGFGELKLMLTTGFLGAYTTFSTYGLESVTLIKRGVLINAIIYWGGSAILGLVCVELGTILAIYIIGRQ